MSSMENPSAGRTIAGWAILALPLLFFVLLFINPLMHNLILSFQTWNGLGPSRPAGLSNYAGLFADERFGAALVNTFASPGVYFRILLLTACPLALALLLMELRPGARLGLHAALSPLLLFSGAIVTAVVTFIYFSPRGGLARALTPSLTGEPVNFLGDPARAAGVLGNLLLANGLALALPFGIAAYLASARGARELSPNGSFSHKGFWAGNWRLVVASAVAAAGLALVGLEGAFALPLPLHAGDNVVTYSFTNAFRMMRIGPGAASILFLSIPLLLLGLLFVRFLESRRAHVSIRLVPRLRSKLTAGAEMSGGRVAVIIAAAGTAVLAVVALVVTVLLPWLGAVVGLGEPTGPLPGDLGARFAAGLAVSLATALVSAVLCWAFSAAAGFAFGYLRPAGSRRLLTLIGMFVFIGPAFSLLPYYLTFRNLGLVNSAAALILPGVLSPAGVLLFTWYFRGAREERSGRNAGAGRTRGSFLLFSLPVLALYLLSSLNMTLLPVTMLTGERSYNAPLFLLQTRGRFLMSGPGLEANLVQLSYLMYVIPLALLIVSVIFVFPRLALVIRRKGEAAPPLDPQDAEKLKG